MKFEKSTWHCQVLLVVCSQFFIISALDMSDPYWPLILSSSHLFNPRTLQYWSGTIYMAPLLTTIFTTLLWTKIGERRGYKKMILRAGFALAATQWSLFFFSNLWAMFAIRLIQGALAGFTAAVQAWSLAMTPVNNHSQMIGRLQAATAMGSVVGPIGGGLLSHYCGYLSIFITSGGVCLLCSIVLAQYLPENAPSIVTRANDGIKKYLLGERNQNLLLVLICSTQAARWMSAPFFALYLAGQLHADNVTLGFIYAIIALAMFVVTPTLGKTIDQQACWHARAKYWLMIALCLSGLTQCGFALITRSYVAFALSLLWGVNLGIISLILFNFLLRGIHENSRAKAVGLGNAALKLGNLLGIGVGAVIQAEGHFMLSFIVIGGVYFMLAVLAGCYTVHRVSDIP